MARQETEADAPGQGAILQLQLMTSNRFTDIHAVSEPGLDVLPAAHCCATAAPQSRATYVRFGCIGK
jgi:hypothetical protein